MRNCEEKEERLMLLESWRSFEDEFGTASDKERVDKLMPEKVKKRRKVQADDGVRTEPAALVLHASRAEMPDFEMRVRCVACVQPENRGGSWGRSQSQSGCCGNTAGYTVHPGWSPEEGWQRVFLAQLVPRTV